MKIIRPPKGISLDRLRQIEYHLDVRHGPFGALCPRCRKIYQPQVRELETGEFEIVKAPPIGDECPECQTILVKGPERFVPFLYRGGQNLEAWEAMGELVDMGSPFTSVEDAADYGGEMERRHLKKRGRLVFVV